MSWEGYEQTLCKNGHQSTEDAYVFDPEKFVCEMVLFLISAVRLSQM